MTSLYTFPRREHHEIANVQGWRIASLDHTRGGGPWIWWWGPNNGGYDDTLDTAGVYELDGLRQDADYYGRRNNLCVPDYVARRLAGGRDRAKNIVANWEHLWVAALFRQGKPNWPAPYDPKPVNEEAKRFNKRFPVGSLVRVVRHGRAVDIAVRGPARNVDDRAVVQLAGLGAVRIADCYSLETTCSVCGDDLLTTWRLEDHPDQYAGKKVGDCPSCVKSDPAPAPRPSPARASPTAVAP